MMAWGIFMGQKYHFSPQRRKRPSFAEASAGGKVSAKGFGVGVGTFF
jgi:hypothetical protein